MQSTRVNVDASHRRRGEVFKAFRQICSFCKVSYRNCVSDLYFWNANRKQTSCEESDVKRRCSLFGLLGETRGVSECRVEQIQVPNRIREGRDRRSAWKDWDQRGAEQVSMATESSRPCRRFPEGVPVVKLSWKLFNDFPGDTILAIVTSAQMRQMKQEARGPFIKVLAT